MQNRDQLDQRVRDGLLLDTYAPLLTEKQRLACEIVLLRDLSLAEAAVSLNVSRQGVHDLLSRARDHMENTERVLGLLEKNKRLALAVKFLEEEKESLSEHFYKTMKKLLEP